MGKWVYAIVIIVSAGLIYFTANAGITDAMSTDTFSNTLINTAKTAMPYAIPFFVGYAIFRIIKGKNDQGGGG